MIQKSWMSKDYIENFFQVTNLTKKCKTENNNATLKLAEIAHQRQDYRSAVNTQTTVKQTDILRQSQVGKIN
jgi:hypothetical protein